jgi:hypothetical protein
LLTILLTFFVFWVEFQRYCGGGGGGGGGCCWVVVVLLGVYEWKELKKTILYLKTESQN